MGITPHLTKFNEYRKRSPTICDILWQLSCSVRLLSIGQTGRIRNEIRWFKSKSLRLSWIRFIKLCLLRLGLPTNECNYRQASWKLPGVGHKYLFSLLLQTTAQSSHGVCVMLGPRLGLRLWLHLGHAMRARAATRDKRAPESRARCCCCCCCCLCVLIPFDKIMPWITFKWFWPAFASYKAAFSGPAPAPLGLHPIKPYLFLAYRCYRLLW